MARGDTGTHTQSLHTLLIVDDEPSLRFSIGEWARDVGFRPLEAANSRTALDYLKQSSVDAILLDLKLGDEDGLQVLKALREDYPDVPIVMLTGHGSIEHAVQATKLGAYNFMTKPPNLEHLEVVLRRGIEHARLLREVSHLRAANLPSQSLLGESAAMRKVLQRLDRVARSSNATVLVQGESGSGKELMASYVHGNSARADGPFVTLNCAAIPEHLLESELYGHEKGSFTDAKRSKSGLFELADGGTLFLDEIGEMSLGLQAKLLRVLETHTFRRVGGQADVTVDVRVVAATHNDLKRKVADGGFRQDLYFRLNVVPVEMPPLREHAEDIPLLADHYIAHYCKEQGRMPVRLHPDALSALMAYSWPGNVRELKNVILRVLILEAEDEILPHHLPPEVGAQAAAFAGGSAAVPFQPGVVRPLADVERMAIEHALQVCEGNKTKTASMLGISRQTLRTKLKEYRLGDDGDLGEA